MFSGSDGSEKHTPDTGAFGTPRSSTDPREDHTPPLGSPRSSKLHADSGWARKLQARSNELRRLFDLDSTEQLMDDFMCALRKKVLLQGRLFVFERHLCFFSSLFGYQKAKVVPFTAVMEITKKKNVGFPNSILVVWDCPREGIKNEFFTSFLSREEAYKLIVGLWAQCSDKGKNILVDYAHQQPAATRKKTDISSKANVSALKRDENAGLSRRWSKWVGIGFGNDGTEHNEEFGESSDVKGAGEQPWELSWHEPSSLTPPPSDSHEAAPKKPANEAEVADNVREFEELPPCSNSKVLASYFQGATDPAPPLPSNMQKILSLRLPTSTRGFFVAFLCPSSNFFVDFHASQGHRDIKLSQWQRHYKVGPVRDFRFVTPLKGWRMGPPQALCHQQHRFKVYASEHLIFEISQVMSDIPYADHFRVEQRWDITAISEPSSSMDEEVEHCQLEVHVAVPFTKNTMWKRFIEKSVMDSTMEAFRMFKELADRQLETMKRNNSNSTELDAVGGAIARAGPSLKENSRPPSPMEKEFGLPTDAAEWEALVNQVDSRWRDGLRALWRQYQASGTTGGGGGGLGSSSGTVPRHRRRGSRARYIDFQKPYQNSASGRKSAPLSPGGESVENRIAEDAVFAETPNSTSMPPRADVSPLLSPPPLTRQTRSRWQQSSLIAYGGLALVVCLQIVFIFFVVVYVQPRKSPFGNFEVSDGGSDSLEALRSALLQSTGSIAHQLKVIQQDAESLRRDLQRIVNALSD